MPWADNKPWFKVQVDGLPELRKLLKGPPPGENLFGNPFRKAMAKVGDAAEQMATVRAPIGKTGRLVARLSHRVSPAPIPGWVEVRTTARSAARSAKWPGYPYPRRLNWEKKNKRYGWLSRAIEDVGSRVEGFLQEAAREVERIWGRK